MKLICISAVWCMSCIIMNPIIDKVGDKLNLEVIKYDYDTDDICEKYNVKDILPVIILEKEGVELTRIIGEVKEEEIYKIIGDFNV